MKLYLNILAYLLIAIASCFYTTASFYSIGKHFGVIISIIVSLLFATGEYIFKIPAYSIIKKNISTTDIQLIWVVFTFITSILYQKFIEKKNIESRTIIVVIVIIIAMIFNFYKM